MWCDTALPLEAPWDLEGRELFLADGHHRFAAGHNFAMIQARDSSLRSLPSHRLVVQRRGLELPETSEVEDIDTFLSDTPKDRWRGVVLERGREPRGIDISRLFPLVDLFRDAVVEPTREIPLAIAAVESGEVEMAILVAAYTVEQIEDYARRGVLLPPKSTDFYPKLRHPFQNENVVPATAHRRGVRYPSS